jgi:hypothetical protein
MAKAELSWEDQSGTSHGAPAMIEDTSVHGACIRVGTKFLVGSRLLIKRRTENFAGVVKYCRRDGEEFVIGVQREIAAGQGKIQSLPGPPEVNTNEYPAARIQPDSPPKALVTSFPEMDRRGLAKLEEIIETHPATAASSESNALLPAEAQPQKTSNRNERTIMDTKWLHLPSRRRHEAPPNGDSNDTSGREKSKQAAATSAKEPFANHVAKGRVNSQATLLSLEDIYRACGIVTLRDGYGINKVVEMLDSDHIRELSVDVKRASVLMALDATGVTMDEILKDATQRLDAMNSYETNQCRHLAEYEALKSNENAQIRSEMERETARYLGRIKQNLDAVALEKDKLQQWQTIKQGETQRIAGAVAVCAKHPVADTAASLAPAIRALGVVGKSS